MALGDKVVITCAVTGAVTTKDVVRIASSRDEGRTWTPFVVAFDGAEHPRVR